MTQKELGVLKIGNHKGVWIYKKKQFKLLWIFVIVYSIVKKLFLVALSSQTTQFVIYQFYSENKITLHGHIELCKKGINLPVRIYF